MIWIWWRKWRADLEAKVTGLEKALAAANKTAVDRANAELSRRQRQASPPSAWIDHWPV